MTELQRPTAALPNVTVTDRVAGTLVGMSAFSSALVAYPKIKNQSAPMIAQDVASFTNHKIGDVAGTAAYGLGVAAIPLSLVFGYLVTRGISRRVRHYYQLRSMFEQPEAAAAPKPARWFNPRIEFWSRPPRV